MGKGKTKKSAPTPNGEEFSKSPESPQPTGGREHPLAADGHDVVGWTDKDIRTYNTLLTEKAKLEKEKTQLQQKSARHHTERALLNQGAASYDSQFRTQPGGEYKFVGESLCCLDFDGDSSAGNESLTNNICHHELCGRAKTQGMSWLEMDTIKYYRTRITSEKSPRMRDALKKQRGVELVQIKKDEEEEMQLKNRRAGLTERSTSPEGLYSPTDSHDASDFSFWDALAPGNASLNPEDNAILEAAKENELVVKKIRSRLDKIRFDVHAGKVTAKEARQKLDQANKEMAEAERKNNTFKDMILIAGGVEDAGAGGLSQDNLAAPPTGTGTSPPAVNNLSHAITNTLAAASSNDDFSQTLSLMKGIFSASDPRDIQAAITDLRTVFEINGTMSPALQKSFLTLEDLFHKPGATNLSLPTFPRNGHLHTAENIVEVLLMLRNPQERTTLNHASKMLKLDKETIKKNDACLRIELKAQKTISTILKAFKLNDSRKTYEQLREVKEQAVDESPIPELSDIVLTEKLEGELYMRTVVQLVERSWGAGDDRELRALITAITISYSDKDKNRFIITLARLVMETHRLYQDTQLHPDSITAVMVALAGVEASMSASVAKAREGQTDTTVQPQELCENSNVDLARMKRLAAMGRKRYNISRNDVNLVNASFDANAAGELLDLSRVTPDDLSSAILRDLPAGDPRTDRLREDLEHMLFSPKDQQNPLVVQRIRDHMLYFKDLGFSDLTHKELRAGAKASKESKAHVKGQASKVQEKLTTNGDPSPPAYSANESHARRAKLKQVPVKTPQIQDRPTQTPKPTAAASQADAGRMVFNQKTFDMTRDLKSMRKELQALAASPGLHGKRATTLREQLESVLQQVNNLDAELNQRSVNGSNGKGKARELNEVNEKDLRATIDAYNKMQETFKEMSLESKKVFDPTRKERRGPKKSDIGLYIDNPNPNAPALFPPPKFDDQLSKREEIVRVQLYNMMTNIKIMSGSQKPSGGIKYTVSASMWGNNAKHRHQFSLYVVHAMKVAEKKEWTGLKDWILKTFDLLPNGDYAIREKGN